MKPLIRSSCLYIIILVFSANVEIKGNPTDFDTIATEIEKKSFFQHDETKVLLQRLRAISGDCPEDNPLYARRLYYETLFNYNHGKYDSLLVKALDEHLEYLLRHEEDNLLSRALVNYSLASNYLVMNEYSNSFFRALQASSGFRELNDSIYLSKALNLLGIISSKIYSYNLANDYYSEALAYTSSKDAFYYIIKGNLFMVNSFLQGHPQALIDSIASLISPAKSLIEHPSELMSYYINLAGIHSTLGNFQTASYYQDTIFLLTNDFTNYRLLQSILYNQAFYYTEQNQLDSGLYYYKEATSLSELLSDKSLTSNCLLGISNIYNRLNNIDSAYFYIMKHNELESDLNKNAKMLEATQSFITSLLNYSEREVEIREQEIKNKNRTIIAAAIIIIGSIVLVVLLLIIIRQKKNKQALLRASVDSKTREISSISLLLSGKNNVLSDIQEVIKQLPDTMQKEAKIEDINKLIKNNLNTETDWDTFVMHFEQVHPNFFSNLKKHSDELTPTNLRFCAYFRIGLSTKEIANMLNITPTTVKVTRFRLKKKFGLTEEESLDEFIAGI